MNKKSSTKDLSLSSNERLFINNKSLFSPKKYIKPKPNGLKIYTYNAGFKKRFNDLLVIIFDETVESSAVYSKTSMPSAPIIWDKLNNKGKAKALIVNSGNANAHTGSKGIKIIDKYVNYLSKVIGCNKNEILVSSTGIIGEQLNPDKIIKKIKNINKTIPNDNLLDAALSIMTTDTYPKITEKKVSLNGKTFKIYGIAKGSGMIHPNMGTMLSYVFIQTYVPKIILKKLINNNLKNTFNSISTDGDTSTSDTFVLFSNNKKLVNFNINKNFEILNKSVFEVMEDLSLKVVKDGEGISKLIKLNIIKGKSKNQVMKIGFSIINSPLVKTAIAGEDANWGRIIAAIGKSNQKINQSKIKIFFGKNLVCQKGFIYNKINLRALNMYMKCKIIEISVVLDSGSYKHTFYGNDLTHEYIRINAEYRS